MAAASWLIVMSIVVVTAEIIAIVFLSGIINIQPKIILIFDITVSSESADQYSCFIFTDDFYKNPLPYMTNNQYLQSLMRYIDRIYLSVVL